MADVKAIITEAATRYGIDPDTALRIAYIETGGTFNPSAQNQESSAGGLFQFIDSTWANYGNGKHKYDPHANADAAMRLTRDNANFLRSKLGREPTPGELYLAHQQGAGGAWNILKNPTARAADVVGSKAVKLNGGDLTMSAAAFGGLWIKKLHNVDLGSGPLVGGMAPPASVGNMTDNPYNVHQETQISYGETAAAMAATDKERREIERQNEEKAYGFIEGAGAAIWNEWSILTPFRAIYGHDADPDYRLDMDKLRGYSEGIPDQYLSEFEDAVSDEHAQAIRKRLLTQLEVNERLGAMGGTGFALSLAAAATDPGAIAATMAIAAATGGLGVAPAVAARFGRVGLVGLGAAEGALGNMAVDIPLIAVDPTRDASSLKWSAGTGLLMGGAFGALRKNPMFKSEADAMVRIGKEIQREAVDEKVGEVATKMVNDGNLNAAKVIPDASYRTDTDADLGRFRALAQNVSVFAGKVRFDVTAQMLKSSNPAVKVAARYLLEDAARDAAGNVTQIAASEVMSRLYRVHTYNWTKGFGDAWDAYRKANKINMWKSGEALHGFKRDVAAYIRETDPSRKAQFPQEVKAAGDTFNREMQSWWKMAQEAGLTRSEQGVENYFPRYANLTNAANLIDKYGYTRDFSDSGLTALYREAIMAKQKGIDPNLATKMAYAIVDRFMKLHAGENLMDRHIGSNDLDDLEDMLRHYLTPDEIQNVRDWVGRNEPDWEKGASDASRMKHRVILDENFVGKVRNRYTGQMEEVRISDFYINDPNLAFHLYSRNIAGNVALAKVRIVDDFDGEVLVDGIRSKADWVNFKERVLGMGQKTGANNTKDMENLDYAYAMITGTPYRGANESSDFATVARLMRDFNFFRLMGQVGFSQLPELASTTSQVGLKTMYQALPSFRKIINLARTGKLGDDLEDEMLAIGAFGTDYTRTRFFHEADDFGTPITLGADTAIQRFAGKVNPALHHMNRFVATASFMHPVNALFQRWASRAFAVRMTKIALGNDTISPKRLAALGLSPEDAEEIFKAIRQSAKFRGNVRKGGRLEALGIKDWDGNVAAKFEAALYRATRNMILENDPGQFAKWMNHPLGKMFIQFRTFAISAWTKATLQGVNMKDFAAAMGFLSSSLVGALVYAGQTNLNLIGDSEREKKLEERLSWGKLALAGIQRSSASSLVPMFVDTAAYWTTGDHWFDTRSSGTNSDLITGMPGKDFYDSASAGISGLLTAAAGDDYSQQDARNLIRAFTPSRLMGLTQLFNWMISDLPAREMRE